MSPGLDRRPFVVVAAAMREELAPLVRRLESVRRTSGRLAGVEGTLRGVRCLVVWSGVGEQAAKRSAAMLLDELDAVPDHAFVVGLAGALDPDLEVGAVVEPGRVVMARAMEETPAAQSSAIRDRVLEPEEASTRKLFQTVGATMELNNPGPILVSSSRLLPSAIDKGALWQVVGRERGALVDMETYWFLEPFQAAGTRVHALRSISDAATEDLPPFLATPPSADGRVDRLGVVAKAVRQPTTWSSLLRLRRRLRDGAGKLALRMEEKLVHLADEDNDKVAETR